MTKHDETKLMETFAALMLSKAYQGVLPSELSAFPLDLNISDQPVLSL
jgi:ABC-type thiamine transport system substrate-binding protein